jgi:hypothetical protein
LDGDGRTVGIYLFISGGGGLYVDVFSQLTGQGLNLIPPETTTPQTHPVAYADNDSGIYINRSSWLCLGPVNQRRTKSRPSPDNHQTSPPCLCKLRYTAASPRWIWQYDACHLDRFHLSMDVDGQVRLCQQHTGLVMRVIIPTLLPNRRLASI